MHVQFYSNIVIDTTGLQPATTTVMEVNGSITVTCVFASGASSTGCQVTIFIKDSLQEVLSRKIIRPHGSSMVSSHPNLSLFPYLSPEIESEILSFSVSNHIQFQNVGRRYCEYFKSGRGQYTTCSGGWIAQWRRC